MDSKLQLERLAICFYSAGLFTITWDKIFTLELGGFSLRLSQLLFLVALCGICWEKKRTLPQLIKEKLWAFPALFSALATYYLLTASFSYFPLKSFLYSGWLLFNLATVWGTAQLFSQPSALRTLIRVLAASLAFHAATITIDQVAFQFGYTSGLIGFNQNEILKWGISRPHAFSFEPSYIATFLALGILLLFPSLLSIRLKSALTGSVLVFALVATTSRTGWLTAALGMGIILVTYVWRQRKIPWKPLLWVSGALCAIALVFVLQMPPEQRKTLNQSLVSSVVAGTDGSGNQRLRAHIYAARMAKDTQWLGTGMGASFKYWADTVNTWDTAQHGKFRQETYADEVVMSTWGQLLAEGGIPAILIFAAAAGALLLRLWKAWMNSASLLVLGAFSAAAAWFFFTSFWLGNVVRGDIWIWYALWCRIACAKPEELNLVNIRTLFYRPNEVGLIKKL